MATKLLNIQDYAGYIKCGEILKSPLPDYEYPFILKCYQCEKINFVLESFIIHIQQHCKNVSEFNESLDIKSPNEDESESIENPTVKIETMTIEVDDPLIVIKDEVIEENHQKETESCNNIQEDNDNFEDYSSNSGEEFQTDDAATEDDEMCLSRNIFDECFAKNTQEVNANQFVMPKVPKTLPNEPVLKSSTSLLFKTKGKNKDILAVLKEIAHTQKEIINTRLKKLEENQANIMQNQGVLSNGQAFIMSNQLQIANRVDKIEESSVSKAAQSKLLMEFKVAIKKLEESVCRVTGENFDKNNYEIANMLPFKTLAAIQDVEQKLEIPDFAQEMTSFLNKLKGASEDVGSVIRDIFTDDLLENYNWEGSRGKQSLGKLILFNKTLRDVFRQQGALEYEKSVRKAIERSHHRVKQKKYLKKNH